MRWLLPLVVVALCAAPAAADRPTPWLGVTYQELGGGGVLVTEVHPGTPAALAGLRGQDLILMADGQPVFNFGVQIRAATIGRRFPLVIERDGRRVSIVPRLTARPAPDELAHRLLVGHDLPALPAHDELGLPVRREWWRGTPMVAVVFDARCGACAGQVAALVDELTARRAIDRAVVRVLVLADSPIELDALRARVPLPIPAWRVERAVGAPLLGALDPREDGVVVVTDRDDRIVFAAAVSSGAVAHDGACQVVAGLAAAR